MKPSRYVTSAPKRDPADTDDKAPRMCQIDDCTSFYPGFDKPCQRGRADVQFTSSDGARIELCCHHYDRAIYRMGLGRMSEITGRGIDLTLDAVHDHWSKLDATEAERTRKRVVLADRLRIEPVAAYTEVSHDSAA